MLKQSPNSYYRNHLLVPTVFPGYEKMPYIQRHIGFKEGLARFDIQIQPVDLILV